MIAPSIATRPLWTCPKCGKAYVTRDNWHSCTIVTLNDHFAGKPEARRLFRALRKTVESLGPVKLALSKNGIAFMVRVRFAGCQVRKDWLRCAVWLRRPVNSTRIVRTERYTARDYGHYFEVRKAEDIDAEILALLREAYDIGCQRHLTEA
jgi:predicted transport protein